MGPAEEWAYLAGGVGILAPRHQGQQLGHVLFHKLLTLRKDRQYVGPVYKRTYLSCRPGILPHSIIPSDYGFVSISVWLT